MLVPLNTAFRARRLRLVAVQGHLSRRVSRISGSVTGRRMARRAAAIFIAAAFATLRRVASLPITLTVLNRRKHILRHRRLARQR